MAASPFIHNSTQAANARTARIRPLPKKGTDDTFHLSPFPHLHDHTISPVYSANYCPSLSKSASSHDLEQREDGPDGDDRDATSDVDLQESDIVVPPPNNSAEAFLLLETARADRQVRLTRKNLALQIVHRNTLTLQYNRLILEKAQEELRSADRLVGHVRFSIRKSGIPVVSEYAMHEDHSVHLPSSVYSKKLD
ncbi:hypothetical protein EDD15DRAFT_2367940 [Pisolithus albus]|nr:hypothetical protein EDD15DRAFT_2367940 [Pisolithus albus]